MPASASRPAARLATAVLLVVVVGGCAGTTDESTTAQASTTSSTVAPTTTTLPPMTAKELAWLKAIPKVHKKIDRALETSTLTTAVMLKLANTLRSCGRELVRGGSPSDRLQPVYVLVKRGCRGYDKGAACFTTAARFGIVFAGSAEDRKQTKAIECGFAARAKGGVPLLDAQDKGDEIRAEVG